ncbi:lysozyme inhibitor LprI family protein [Hydrogenophaga atypica]|uniref:Lysozyme inhibitor LprI family protein n=1 Tax=Hydrogenophaga atypica TaxID=249409 RepID=A0ABW2QJU8_9BURK
MNTALVAGLTLASACLIAPTLQAASFDCAKARTAVEKTICGSAETAQLDEHMGRYHAAARRVLSHADSCLVADQRAWLRGVRDACKNVQCLNQTYLERLAVLHALQPGVTSLRHINLPQVPPLVWIVPPAEDQVAAPRHLATRPLVVRGQLLDEVNTGDGFFLRSAAGTRYLLHGLMYLEQASTDALTALARTPGVVYEVRGRSERVSTDVPGFAPGQCAFVYRMVP